MYRRLFTVFFILTLHFAFGESTVEQMKTLWKAAVEKTPSYPETLYKGRGIVIAAGGVNYMIDAWVGINMLRESGCQLPIEVWYIGEEEIVPSVMEKLLPLGVVLKDVTDYFDHPIKGYEVKVHAIVASEFQEVLLIDADNMALRNPEYLFNTFGYLKTGALFWPDIQVIEKNNLLLDVLELPKQRMRGQESGQLLIDKKRCWLPLNLTLHMNQRSDFYYKHVLGDKDTFLLSWKALKTPFSMISSLPAIVKKTSNHPKKFSCFLQRDSLGKPLFCHAVNYNWAQRNTSDLLWKIYMLPKQRSHCLSPVYPFTEVKYQPFDDRFPLFELRCIKYWNQVKHIGSTCRKNY